MFLSDWVGSLRPFFYFFATRRREILSTIFCYLRDAEGSPFIEAFSQKSVDHPCEKVLSVPK